jgi:serine/threonine protein kinase
MSELIEAADDDLESLVGRVADEYTDRVNRGEQVAIDEYAERYPQIADVLRQMLPSLGLLGKLSALPGEDDGRPVSTAAVPEYLGDYRIVREIGRGGMGVVYEAEQKSLGRRVALKVLPFHRLMDPLYLKRFEREARAAARLHHTNIVPVFGVGEDGGIHFYAMQYIAGQGLDRVISELRRFRQAGGQGGSEAYSHSFSDSASSIAQSLGGGGFDAQGANQYGDATSSSSEPEGGISSVSDHSFSKYLRCVAGLGIQVADALAYAHSQGVLHRDIKPSNLLLDSAGIIWVTDFGLAKADDTEDLTHSGDVIGTLRYVAPERLAGRYDARSDIFSLGLTLYELLTLRPAYDDKVQGRLVQQVTAAEPPSPRRIDRRIPSDLNTIIETAIAKEPERRYSTASEFAKDLQRFLEDRPIEARKAGRVEQAWRWCRRNPAIASLGAAFLAALFIGLGAVIWQWRLTEGQRLQAEANFKKARDAVDECFTTVTENPVLQEPGMEGARQVLFQAALKYYKDFLNQRADDPGARTDLGRAYYRLGYITERIASKSDALDAYQQACALFEKLLDSEPATPHLRVELAQCYQSLGELERLTGQSARAEVQLLKALAARAELVQSYPDEPDYQRDLASAHQALGTLYRTTSRPAQAEDAYRHAQVLREQIVRNCPSRGDYRNALAAGFSELCRLYASTGRPEEAEASLRKALTTLDELTRDFSEVSEYQDNLATGYNSLGSFLLNSGRGFNQIEGAYRKALTIREQLVRDHPKVQEYQSELARVYNNLALWHFLSQHDDQAADNYARALALREQLARKHPEAVAYQKAVATTHHDLGLLFRRDCRWSEAEHSFRRALAIQQQLLERNREVSDFALELATTQNNLGLIAHDQGKEQVAIDWYTRAAHGLDAVLEAEPRQTDARRLLAQAYAGRAWSLSNLGKDSEALVDWDRSLAFTRDDLIPGALLGRAATLAHLGNYLEAISETDRLTPQKPSGLVPFIASARVYAAAVPAAARDPKLGPADRRSRAEKLAVRSIELLKRGHQGGELDNKPAVASLKLDRDFEAIRSRSDFVLLLKKIETTIKN